MKVWYSSHEDKILSDYAHKRYFEDLVESYNTEENFASFLNRTYYASTLFNLTDANREEIRGRFSDWMYDQATAGDTYKPYEIQFVIDKEEE